MTLDAKVTYTSRWYDLPARRRTARTSWWWQHMVIMPTQDKGEHPPEHEFLVNFFPIEGNRSIACMGSWGIDMPRTTEELHRARPNASATPHVRRARWRHATRPLRST